MKLAKNERKEGIPHVLGREHLLVLRLGLAVEVALPVCVHGDLPLVRLGTCLDIQRLGKLLK